MTTIAIAELSSFMMNDLTGLFDAGREAGRLFGDNEFGHLTITNDPAAHNGSGAYQICLHFDDPNDAMLFKLAWQKRD